jgi:hypothetical protein
MEHVRTPRRSGVSIQRRRPESVQSSVMNGKFLPTRLPASQQKLLRTAMLVFALARTHMIRYR